MSLKDEYEKMHDLMNRLLARKEANARELEALLPEAIEKIADGESLGNRINELQLAKVMHEEVFPFFESQYIGIANAYHEQERAKKSEAEAKELAERTALIANIKKGAVRKIFDKISSSVMFIDKAGRGVIVTPQQKIIEVGCEGSDEYEKALAPYKSIGWFQ